MRAIFIEAAVAYYEATGKDKLLQVVCRLVDHIDSMFGPEEGKKRGYPGHEEIELALIRLYRVTRDERHLRLAQFFVEERGKEPHYFQEEARARGLENFLPLGPVGLRLQPSPRASQGAENRRGACGAGHVPLQCRCRPGAGNGR